MRGGGFDRAAQNRPSMNFRSTGWLAAAVAVAAFVSQAAAFEGPLLFDDLVFIRPGGVYVVASRLHEALSNPLGGDTFYWRPVATTSLLVDALVHGLGAGGFRVTNALLHAATSVIALLLLVRLLPSRGAAMIAALAWALHPVHVETVTWISARFDLFAGLFTMLALLATESDVASAGRLCACAAAALAACLSKESAVVVPVVIGAWTLARGRGAAATRFAAAATSGVVIACLLRLRVLGYVAGVRAEAMADAGNPLQRLLLVGRSIATHATTIVFPWGTVGPMHCGDRPIPSDDVLGWTGVALGVALVGAAVLAWRRSRPAALLLAALLATLAPVSEIVPLDLLGHVHAADRYMYLPAFFAVAAAAWGACAIASTSVRTAVARAACVLVVALAAGRIAIVPRWNDAVRFWSWAVAMAPTNSVARVNLAYSCLDRDLFADAEVNARMVPDGDKSVLADVLAAQGRCDEAIGALDDVTKVWPGDSGALLRRADLLERLGRWPEAVAGYQVVVRMEHGRGDDDGPFVRWSMAGVAEAAAHLDPAAARGLTDDAARAATNDDPAAWLHIARARRALGDAAGAASASDRASAAGADARSIQALRTGVDAIMR